LGRVIEKITGQAYETYVRNTILLPLNITDMHTGHNLLSGQLPNEVNYYDYPSAPYAFSVYDNTTLVPWPYGGFNIEAMDSHGAWVASAEDLCRLLVAVDGFSTKPDILSQATTDTMIHPSSTNANYALGWCVNTYNNWWHTGSLPGTTTEIVRGSNQLNWAILLNTRPYNYDTLTTAVDNLVWNVLPGITNWPAFDQFSGIDKYEKEASFSIFPNPSGGKFVINSNGNITSIEIYNLHGERVYSDSKKPINKKINLSGYSKGIYFIKIYEGERFYTEKVMIQ
jgi:hypothetical protein